MGSFAVCMEITVKYFLSKYLFFSQPRFALQVVAAVRITDATMYVLAECKDAMDFEIAQTFQTSIIVVSIETVLGRET